jgi:hypothetical protein
VSNVHYRTASASGAETTPKLRRKGMTIQRNRFLLTTSLALIGFTTTALADEWNKETILRFSGPVEVPGKVLQAGKYIFRLADSQVNRNIVQIFSEDEKGNRHFVTTILANSAYRMETPDKAMIQFEERRAGDPEAIKNWFYPGDNYGWQFTYPKSERLEASIPVSLPDPTPVAAEPAALPEAPAEGTIEPTSVIIETEELIIAQFTPDPTPEPVEDTRASADRVLPETAGQSAMLLIAGITMLAAGLATVSRSLFGSRA